MTSGVVVENPISWTPTSTLRAPFLARGISAMCIGPVENAFAWDLRVSSRR